MHFAHASAVNAEILGKAVHSAPLDGALSSDNTVAEGLVEEHVVVVGSVRDEGVNLQKRPFVEQQSNPVPCSPTTAGANGFLALETAAKPRGFSLRSEVFERLVDLVVHELLTSDSVFDSSAHSHKDVRCSPHKFEASAFLMSVFCDKTQWSLAVIASGVEFTPWPKSPMACCFRPLEYTFMSTGP